MISGSSQIYTVKTQRKLLQFHCYAYHTRTDPIFLQTNPRCHYDIIITSSPPMTSFLHHYDIILTYDLISLHYDIIARTL